MLLTISNVDLSPSSSGEEGHRSWPEKRLAGHSGELLQDLVSRVSIGVEIRVSMSSDHPGGHTSDNTCVSVDHFQTSFIRVSGFLSFLKFLWVFFLNGLNLLMGDATALENVLSIMTPVVFGSHSTSARNRDGELSIFRLVFFDFSCRFFLETENAFRNEPCRESNSSNLSAKKELFSFENEGVSVHFLLKVTCELAFSSSGGVDVVSKKVG